MGNIFKVYDVFSNKNKLNSQVIFNNIGFEIPNNYYFEKNATNIEENSFQLIGNSNYKIDLKCMFLNEYEFNDKIKKYSNTIINSFQNYRNQKIYEMINDEIISIFGYDGKVFFELKSNAIKYSQEYFELYYIAFSFSEIENYDYDNSFFQKNNYCILKNGKYVYDNYNENLIYKNPYEYLKKINTINFNEYINKNNKYDYKLKNDYIKNEYNNIVEKIEHYKSIVDNDKELLDVIEEN